MFPGGLYASAGISGFRAPAGVHRSDNIARRAKREPQLTKSDDTIRGFSRLRFAPFFRSIFGVGFPGVK